MQEGKQFLNKCLKTKILLKPWPHQIIKNTLSKNVFKKLKMQCEKLDVQHTDLVHIYPKDYKKYNIDFYDETVSICKNLLENAQILCGRYPEYRWFLELAANAHISITPPLPWKFYIHQESIDKIWSSITYITPQKNVGTKMYRWKDENTFIKEAPWKPNNTFIFCGRKGKTWHSYESTELVNRITFNVFLAKAKDLCFYKLSTE